MTKKPRFRLWRAEEGVSAVEFAFVAAALSWLILGVLDFGMIYWDQTQVSIAAQAGADYAAGNPAADTTAPPTAIPTSYSTNIQSAVTGATSLATVSASPAPYHTCGCPTATGGIASFSCASNCDTGGAAGTYVVVSATGSYSSIFPWFSNCPASGQCSVSLAATAFVRIK